MQHLYARTIFILSPDKSIEEIWQTKRKKNASAKLTSIKHCKFYQVSLSSNKFDPQVFIFFSVMLFISVLSFFSTSELLLSFAYTDLQVDPVGQQWQGLLIPFSYQKKSNKKYVSPRSQPTVMKNPDQQTYFVKISLLCPLFSHWKNKSRKTVH